MEGVSRIGFFLVAPVADGLLELFHFSILACQHGIIVYCFPINPNTAQLLATRITNRFDNRLIGCHHLCAFCFMWHYC